jgi:aspartyl protease family protein
MKVFLSFLIIIFLIFSFEYYPIVISEETNLQSGKVIREYVTLSNNEYFPKKIRGLNITDSLDREESLMFDYYYIPYNWTGVLDVDLKCFPIVNPIVLRSIEQNENFTFEDFKKISFSHFIDLSFPIYFKRVGLINARTYNVLGDNLYKANDNDDFFAYTNLIFKSKICRETLFNYYLEVYKNIEKKYPNTYKQHFINVIDDCLVFLKNYHLNKNKYRDAMNAKVQRNFWELVNQNQYYAFLCRRIEKNNIPVIELNTYLTSLKNVLLNSIKLSNYKNYKDLFINKGEIVISDYEVSDNGVKVKVWNNKINKNLFFEYFQGVKLLREGDVNYYLIYHYDDNMNEYKTLIDINLNVLNKTSLNQIEINNTNENVSVSNDEKIQMKNKNGVYYIPTEVNGYQMEFVFDTGASTVSISLAEAMLLYKNGKLDKTDIIGSQYFSDANGDISEGTKIILRKIKIGNKILNNIEASVVHNLEAPLLLGQSAIKKLGKYTFDTSNNMLIFKRD